MRKILREPLFHFLLIGGGLFFLYSLLNKSDEHRENNIIRIDDSDVQRLIRGYEQSWNTPPDRATLNNLVAEEIKSEVLYREAVRMQLDHNDEIIRRRLKQKYEFLVKDLADNQQPSESELKVFYEENQNHYLALKKLSFSQIYFSPDSREDALQDASDVLISIRDEPNTTSITNKIGDPFHIQNYFDELDRGATRQLFGMEFTNALFDGMKEGWLEPVKSGYGIHLVYITAIKEEQSIPFDSVKEKVISDWKSKKQKQYNQQLYENLLKAYEVEYNLDKWQDQISCH